MISERKRRTVDAIPLLIRSRSFAAFIAQAVANSDDQPSGKIPFITRTLRDVHETMQQSVPVPCENQ